MASRSVNKVILLGNLGRDAETKYTPSGVPRSTFSMATSRRWKDQQTGEWKEETDWHNVVLWRSENVAPMLQKGKQVYIEGRLQTRSWEDKDGNKRYTTEVVADNLILLGGGRGMGEAPPSDEDYSSQGLPGDSPRSVAAAAPATPAAAASEPATPQGLTDDDVVPF